MRSEKTWTAAFPLRRAGALSDCTEVVETGQDTSVIEGWLRIIIVVITEFLTRKLKKKEIPRSRSMLIRPIDPTAVHRRNAFVIRTFY